MNRHTRNGLVGLVATTIPNLALWLALPDIFAAPFSGSWWYMWFPLCVIWASLLLIGLATRGRKNASA